MKTVNKKHRLKINLRSILFSTTILLFLLQTQLPADGGMFWARVESEKLGNLPTSPSQRAVILHNGVYEKLIVQVKYHGPAINFSWVIPLPSIPPIDSIKTIDNEIFTRLYERTQPTIRIVTPIDRKNKTRGVVEAGPGWDSVEEKQSPVQVWEQLEIGPYNVVTISSTNDTALIGWLNQNGYFFPEEAHETIRYYIDKHWHFVAIKVNFQTSHPVETAQSLVPLEITFPSPEIVFPLKISSISAAPRSEILLYVVSTHRMTCNYPTREISRSRLNENITRWMEDSNNSGLACSCKNPVKPENYDYEAFFQTELHVDNQPPFIVEYAGDFYQSFLPEQSQYFLDRRTDYWVTRFRTYLNPDEMDKDVIFTPDPNGDDWYSIIIQYQLAQKDFGDAKNVTLACLGLFLIPLHLIPVFRRRYALKFWMILLLIFSVVIVR